MERKRRTWRAAVTATALAATAVAGAGLAGPAEAYQHFSEDVGGTFQGARWQSLPLALRVDGGPTDLSAEVAVATTTWNDVATARDVFGASTRVVDGSGAGVDFTAANFGSTWGVMTGDGKYEVAVDEDGSIMTAHGLAPASYNGVGPTRKRVVGGQAVIEDMYFVLNASRSNFDWQSTLTHELGHDLGLAHSSVGFTMNIPAALSPVSSADVPTMHPFSIGSGTQRRTLESDDVAALSALYPEGTFTSSTGTIEGRVLRCGSGEPLSGVNVRAVNVADPSIQLTRVTGFDGHTEGRYVIDGVPPGQYHLVVEPLSGNDRHLDGLALYTGVDVDFAEEYHNASVEADCGADVDPQAREQVAVSTGSATADFRVDTVDLAFVVDTTGSMSNEIGAVRDGLQLFIDVVDAFSTVTGRPFPNTAVVTFKDDVTVNTVTRDADELRTIVGGLSASGGGDCPEASNAALIAAGRLLSRGGRAVLATDADSRPDGPSRATVDALYTGRGARLSTVLSGTCSGVFEASGATAGSAQASSAQAPSAQVGDAVEPVDELGPESSIVTFSELSATTGGFFAFQPEVKSGDPVDLERFANTVANVAVSSVTPAVGLLTPSRLPQGTTIDAELVGANTNFGGSSVVEVAAAGITVLDTTVVSPTRMLVRLQAAAGAALGFHDLTVRTTLGGGVVEEADGIGTLEVITAPTAPTILAITPASAERGDTVDVTISGGSTAFAAGTSTADFGPGIDVEALAVESPTRAVATVTVADDAELGFRSVSVTTGAEVAAEDVPGPFLVIAEAPDIPTLVSASPASAAQGATITVTVVGEHTSFVDGVSVASVSGDGVTVLTTDVTSPTSATAQVQVAADASLGFRDLTVTTGSESAALLDGFEIVVPTAPPPPPPPPPPPDGFEVVRLAGADRIATAVAISQDRFTAPDSAPAVVLARADTFADALVGTPLAVDRGGPLLLTPSASLDDRVKAEIDRILAPGGTVFVLGGVAALTPAVVAGLGDYEVVRYGGATRFGTAVAIARDGLSDPDRVLLVTGSDFPDALVAGASAPLLGAAVLLTDGARPSAATTSYLAGRSGVELLAVGGPASRAVPTAPSIVGADRFATAVALATQVVGDDPLAMLGVANGAAFPDGLTGGVHVAAQGHPLVLVQRAAVPAPVTGLLEDHGAELDRLFVYGGPEAISDQTAATMATTVGAAS